MMTPWELKGSELMHCNCDWGCPCQFNALPTYGDCQSLIGYRFDSGYFGDTRLDGLRAVWILKWPGPIHEGGGKALIVIDERADDQQKHAIAAILRGEETEPGTSIWNVFAATFDEVYDPVYGPIEIDIDVENRQGRLFVPGVVESSCEPIRNPVSGTPHRARIDFLKGFEFGIAEVANGRFKTEAPVEMAFANRHAHLAAIHWNNQGIIQDSAA